MQSSLLMPTVLLHGNKGRVRKSPTGKTQNHATFEKMDDSVDFSQFEPHTRAAPVTFRQEDEMDASAPYLGMPTMKKKKRPAFKRLSSAAAAPVDPSLDLAKYEPVARGSPKGAGEEGHPLLPSGGYGWDDTSGIMDMVIKDSSTMSPRLPPSDGVE